MFQVLVGAISDMDGRIVIIRTVKRKGNITTRTREGRTEKAGRETEGEEDIAK
jgi:hypothetical protein